MSYPANMKQILFSAIALVLFITPVWAQKSVSADKSIIAKQPTISKSENRDLLSEEFSFLIEDFKMNHQSEVNNLNIKVRLRMKTTYQTANTRTFEQSLKILKISEQLSEQSRLLGNSQQKLTLLVLRKYPMIENITSEIQVFPSEKVLLSTFKHCCAQPVKKKDEVNE
jgi:hypothetical protein